MSRKPTCVAIAHVPIPQNRFFLRGSFDYSHQRRSTHPPAAPWIDNATCPRRRRRESRRHTEGPSGGPAPVASHLARSVTSFFDTPRAHRARSLPRGARTTAASRHAGVSCLGATVRLAREQRASAPHPPRCWRRAGSLAPRRHLLCSELTARNVATSARSPTPARPRHHRR